MRPRRRIKEKNHIAKENRSTPDTGLSPSLPSKKAKGRSHGLSQGQGPKLGARELKDCSRQQEVEVCQCLSAGRRLREARRPRGPRRALVASLCCARKDWAWAGDGSSPARCSKAMPYRDGMIDG